MRGNLAVIHGSQVDGPVTKDKDGEEDGGDRTSQVIVDTTENGFVLTVHGSEEVSKHKVFMFNGTGEAGPQGLIKDLIEALGISDKVKIQR